MVTGDVNLDLIPLHNDPFKRPSTPSHGQAEGAGIMTGAHWIKIYTVNPSFVLRLYYKTFRGNQRYYATNKKKPQGRGVWEMFAGLLRVVQRGTYSIRFLAGKL